MTVYIEQVIIDNIVVNYFLLWFCSLLLKHKKNRARFLISSAVGTVVAIILPMLSFFQTALILVKVLLCFLMILIAFPYKNVKNLLILCFCFAAFTFFLGGVVFGLIVGVFGTYTISNGIISYTSNLPVGLFVLLGFVMFKVFYDVVILSKNKSKLEKFVFEIEVFYNEKTVMLKAFLDTGNMLVCKKTNKPVIVINFKAFQQIANIKTEHFLLGNYTLHNKRYQAFNTANKQSNMLVFEVEKVCLKLKDKLVVINQAVLGLAIKDFSQNLNCDALIGTKIFEMGEIYA